MTSVLPAIIPQDKEQLEEEIQKVSSFAKLVQIDISDGIFSPTKTWPYNGADADYFEKLKDVKAEWPAWQDSVEFEVHLMVEHPENVVLDWIHAGASSIVAHIEATDNFQKFIDLCHQPVLIGLAMKPSTDISKIEPFVSQVDFIQVMGSDDIGKHGVSLNPLAVEVIKKLRERYPERIIAIDIGVSKDTAQELVSAGANKLISGGAILNADNPGEVFNYFQSIS